MLRRLFGREDDQKIEKGLERTRHGLLDRLSDVFAPVDITDETWEELEVRLIQSDVGAATAVALVEDLRSRARYAGVRRADELPHLLGSVMVRALEARGGDGAEERPERNTPPWVVLVVGVNGSGKTTTIAKLGALHRQAGRRVLLVAADTFRAAAIDQLKIWGERAGLPVAAGQPGGDPGAVVFDALSSNAGRAADVVIVDTAGRLHTQVNLMAELAKVNKVIGRAVPGAPHETLLVLDATTGQNGLLQAKAFTQAVAVDGLVLAKLDSSAKGGVAFGVTQELGLPVRYIGTGEGLADLAAFDPAAFVAGLLGRPASTARPGAAL
jgi:fused signal recognition particle receptor